MADFTYHEQYPAEAWWEKSRGDGELGEQASMIPSIFCSKWNPFESQGSRHKGAFLDQHGSRVDCVCHWRLAAFTLALRTTPLTGLKGLHPYMRSVDGVVSLDSVFDRD